MTTHAAATADLTVGPPVDDCQGELQFEDTVVRDGQIWNTFRCNGCGKRGFVERLYGMWNCGERFTESEESQEVKTPPPLPVKRGARRKARSLPGNN
jgi:hypothetical protein